MFSRTADVISLVYGAVCFLALRVKANPLLLVYRIEEDCQLGTLLADIKTDSGLSSRYNRTIVEQLRIVMLESQSAVDSAHTRRHFDIDEVSGLVRAVSSLDRDDICPAAVICTLNVDFGVHPAAYFQLIKVYTLIKFTQNIFSVLVGMHINYSCLGVYQWCATKFLY